MATASLRDQLKNVKPSVKIAPPSNGKLPFSANGWVADGVDHINIARQSKTQLGQSLNLDFVRNWEHAVLGPFRCLNSVWFFIRAKYRNDAIRNMAGAELRHFVDYRCGGFGDYLPNFRIMMLDSMYRRVKVCKEIANDLTRSVLPFDSYRENESGIRIRFEHTSWISAGYEEIRRALKEDREPDFTDIAGRIEGELSEIYSEVIKQIVRETSKEEVQELIKKKKLAEKKLRKRLMKEQERKKQSTVVLSGIQDIDSPKQNSSNEANEAKEESLDVLPEAAEEVSSVSQTAEGEPAIEPVSEVTLIQEAEVPIVTTVEEEHKEPPPLAPVVQTEPEDVNDPIIQTTM